MDTWIKSNKLLKPKCMKLCRRENPLTMDRKPIKSTSMACGHTWKMVCPSQDKFLMSFPHVIYWISVPLDISSYLRLYLGL